MARPRRFRRLRAFLRGDFRTAFSPASTDIPDDVPDDRITRAAPRIRGWEPERENPLPPGWSFEALYYNDAPGNHMVRNPDPTDDEIAGADRIIVSYTDALGKDYRTIYRADSRRKVGMAIQFVTIPESPPR